MIGENGEDDIALEQPTKTINGPWGYACIEDDAVFIPVIAASEEWPMRRVLAHLHEETKLTRFIFTAILDPDSFRPHLRNVVREWDEYVEYMEDHSHCIEIRYEPPSVDSTGSVPRPNRET